jgi:hypothetical protein
MSIKARCAGCGAGFQANDSLAGKRVKCPKCAQPITIGQPVATKGRTGKGVAKKTGASVAAAGGHNPLLDLLDEVQVKPAVRGPICPNCSKAMSQLAVVCVECGYNVETGKQLKTAVYEDDLETGVRDVGMTDAESIMAKAEKDIEDMPVTAHGQDFGDGADSFLIAGVATVVLLILVGIGLTVIFTMDIVSQSISSWFIIFVASLVMWAMMAILITFVAFKQKPVHGIVCIATGGLWCVVYGFMQGKQLLIPTIFLLMAVIVGTASGVYTMYKGIRPAEDQSALPRIRSATEMVLAQEEIFPGTSIQSFDVNCGMQRFVAVHKART